MTEEEQAQGDATVTPRPQPEGVGLACEHHPSLQGRFATCVLHVILSLTREPGALGRELHIQGDLLSSARFRGPFGQTPPQSHR